MYFPRSSNELVCKNSSKIGRAAPVCNKMGNGDLIGRSRDCEAAVKALTATSSSILGNGDLISTIVPFVKPVVGLFLWDFHWDIDHFNPLVQLPDFFEKIAPKMVKLGDFVIPV